MSVTALELRPHCEERPVVEGSPVPGAAAAVTYAVETSELPALADRAVKAGWRFGSLVADAMSAQEPARLDYLFRAPGEQLPVVLRAAARGEVPSIAPLIPGASWAEREVRDLFGVEFSGMPDDRPLVHHSDWPMELHPLRPGEKLELPVERQPGEFRYNRVDGEGVMEIRVGPIHAGIIEPGHFRFSALGERVISVEARLFYVHRGVELRAVGMTPPAALVLAERISGTSAVGHGLAAARALEAALGLEVAPAHAALRLFMLELERFYNHVADLGNLCAGTAMTVLLAEGFALKERLWKMNAALTGSRQLRGVVGFGGVRRAFSAVQLEEALAVVREVLEGLERFAEKYFGSASNIDRLITTGMLTTGQARDLCTVGPVARGSGLAIDSRFDWPRDELEAQVYDGFSPRTEPSGDAHARALVRLHEARDSARLLEKLLPLAAGAGSARNAEAARPSGEGYGWAEGARGETVTYARVEAGRLARLRVRSPSRMNWPAIALAVPGDIVPDFPIINKSFNLSYAGCDL